jgi:hypothetical protein
VEFAPAVPITKFKIRSNSVVFYPSFELFSTVRGLTAASQENLLDNRVKGYLSAASSRKVRDMVENWVNCCKAAQIRSKKSLDFYLCFVTLTLPAKQVHSDLEIKRECLNKFLIYAKRKLKVKNFIWKAEPQKNGNIHFHIIFDRFCDWRKIRAIWNNILKPLGYVDTFARKHGHSDPNSVDVMSMEKDKSGKPIRFIGAYMAKYMSKTAKLTGEMDRPIQGRVWGCSDKLKEIKCFSDFDDSITDRFFQSLKESENLHEFSGDYFRVFSGNWFEVAAKNPELMRRIDLFFWNQYQKINDLIEI